jgi:putative DNA primase/helicase
MMQAQQQNMGENNMSDFIIKMLAAIGSAPTSLVCDTKTHRFSTNGKSMDKAGWYIHPSPDVVIAGCWRSGVTVTLFAGGVTKDDPDALAAIHRARAAYREERAAAAQEAAAKASDLLTWSKRLDLNHEYIKRKDIGGMSIASRLRSRSLKSSVLLDMVNAYGETVGAQTIAPDGVKRFVAGTSKQGAWHWLLNPTKERIDDIIGVVEGWATGCAAAEIHGLSRVAVAFDAGNLEHVVARLLILYPHNPIVIFADDDDINPKTGKRAGKVGAEKARSIEPDRVGIQYPRWSDGEKPVGCSDYADLYLLKCRAIASISTPTQGEI